MLFVPSFPVEAQLSLYGAPGYVPNSQAYSDEQESSPDLRISSALRHIYKLMNTMYCSHSPSRENVVFPFAQNSVMVADLTDTIVIRQSM